MIKTSEKTVLIVNDSADQREMMQILFQQAGCRVLTASDGREAFQFAKNTRLDLIISDVIMPGGDGIELCQWIRSDEQLCSLPILLVSGLRKDSGHIVEGLEVGADDYIELPVDPLQLVARAERLIERNRMEDVLRASENYFRSLIENISDIITILSIEGIILYESPSVRTILGFLPSELIGKNAFDYVHADDLEKVVSYFKSDRERKCKSVRIEYRFKHKSDSWRILESIGKLIEDPLRGTVIIITSRDITERRLAGENINFQARLLDTVEQAVIAIDLDLKVIYWNGFANKLYGWSAAEAVGQNIIDLTTPEMVREQSIEIMKQLRAGKSWSGEIIVRNKSGDTFPIQITQTPVNDDKGRLVGIVGVSVDISERKRTEQVLRESEENFRSLVLATTQYVWTMKENGDGDLGHWWMNFTGQTVDESDGVGWFDAIHPEDREKVGTVWQNAFTNKILFDMTYRVRAKTGEYHYFAVRGVPVFNADGSFRQWIGTFNDISELKQAEESLLKSDEQLRQSQKLESVGRLAGGIAHDFNNMLTAINGYSELTLRKLEAGSPLRQNIEEIKKAGERSAMLTQQLLAFSRKQVLQFNILDLNEVITDTAKLLERLIGEDVRLETQLGAKGHIKGDAGQLSQIIINLAVNARDAMPQGGKLTIETANVFLNEEFAASHFPTKIGAYVMLSVTDNGMGMDIETQEIIFEPFYTTKEVGKGTGLGLATVYGIVKQSGGFIWVESEVDAGSTFTIYLPWIDAEIESQNPVKAVENSPKETAAILVVDDEDIVRTMTRRTLEECGYQVFEAGSGEASLTICRQMNCQIDLVITDVMMPEMDGRELVGKLAELCPELRVLFTSGYANNTELFPNGFGNHNFIQKPFTFDALARQVKESLAGKKLT